MNKDPELRLTDEQGDTLTNEDLITLKKMARAYRSIGWLLSGMIAAAGGALALYDLAHQLSSGTLK